MLRWNVTDARVDDVREYTSSSDNQIHKTVELVYMGGRSSCEATEEAYQAAMGLRGQVVKAGGPLSIITRQFGKNVSTDVRQALDVIQPGQAEKKS